MNENLKLTSPRGRFIYPHLNKPDTKFNPDGEYKLTLSLTSEESTNLLKALEEQIELSKKDAEDRAKGKKVKVADPPYSINEEDGNYQFKFKLKAKAKSSKTGNEWEQKPAIFDSDLKPLSPEKQIWGGTEGKVSFEVIRYFVPLTGAGISLRLKAVQILELVEGSGGDGSKFGFKEEQGYKSDTALEEAVKEIHHESLSDEEVQSDF